MFNQKGQIQIFLVLALLGIILFQFFFKPETKEDETIITGPQDAIKTKTGESDFLIGPADNSDGSGADAEEIKPPDFVPPKVSNPSPEGEIPYDTKKIDIALETDETANCRYSSIKGLAYGQMKLFLNTNALSHSTEVTGLSEGGSYAFYVKCQDQDGNINKEDIVIAFKVKKPLDTTPPQRRNVYPFGETFSAGTGEVVIGISTDEPSDCRYAEEPGKDYSSMGGWLKPSDGTKMYHTAIVRNLKEGESYDFYVKCSDSKGNKNTGDVLIRFNVSK